MHALHYALNPKHKVSQERMDDLISCIKDSNMDILLSLMFRMNKEIFIKQIKQLEKRFPTGFWYVGVAFLYIELMSQCYIDGLEPLLHLSRMNVLDTLEKCEVFCFILEAHCGAYPEDTEMLPVLLSNVCIHNQELCETVSGKLLELEKKLAGKSSGYFLKEYRLHLEKISKANEPFHLLIKGVKKLGGQPFVPARPMSTWTRAENNTPIVFRPKMFNAQFKMNASLRLLKRLH